MAFTGTFDVLSTYNYKDALTTLGPSNSNGSQYIRAQLPDGTFKTLLAADAFINKMCVLTLPHSSKPAGLVIAGNFTSLGGVEAQSIALYEYSTSAGNVEALPGLEGLVSTLLCDGSSNSFYAAGSFTARDSTDLISWGVNGWTNMPFDGFNGPTKAVVQTTSGSTLFGGSFTKLGRDADLEHPLKLNALLEYVSGEIVSETPLVKAGLTLDYNAVVNEMVTVGEDIYIAGNFSNHEVQNIFVFSDGMIKPLPGGGLNDEVLTMLFLASENSLLVGGSFTDTAAQDGYDLRRVANYSISDQQWYSLGGGVNDTVTSLNTLSLNISNNEPETIVIVNGFFSSIDAYVSPNSGGHRADTEEVDGIGVWVPSRNNWLSFLKILDQPEFNGELVTSVSIGDGIRLFAGTLSSWILGAGGVIELDYDSGKTTLAGLGLNLQDSAQDIGSASSAQNANNLVSAGLFYDDAQLKIMVVGGRFVAQGSDLSEVYNLAFINGSNDGQVSGLPERSTSASIECLETVGHVVYAGGSFEQVVPVGEPYPFVNGLLAYDLLSDSYLPIQPKPLAGDIVGVKVISTRPSTKQLYVGGSFTTADGIECSAVCIYDTLSQSWSRPGSQLGGTVSFMTWTSTDSLIVAGNITINEKAVSLATYYVPDDQWLPFNELHPLTGAGAVTAMVSADVAAPGSSTWSSDSTGFYIAGQDDNQSSFLKLWNGVDWQTVDNALFGNTSQIHALQLLTLGNDSPITLYVDANQTLMLIGNLTLPHIGAVSAALTDGESIVPYILTKTSDGNSGMLTSIFSQKSAALATTPNSNGVVIGIAVAVVAVLVSIIVVGELENVWHERRVKSRQSQETRSSSIKERDSLEDQESVELLDWSLRDRKAPHAMVQAPRIQVI
ncbi:MAG: hypothetical protein M1828_006180 [Chrysothrix sp. TS-e1954]|nr:MAG: hypothetical protein M1828_006180 [Chrysothrix sp. TS-e1954]